MKRIFLILGIFLYNSIAFAESFMNSNLYVSGFGGLNFVQDINEDNRKNHLGYAVGMGLGYKFLKFLRLEGEASYRINTFTTAVYVIHEYINPYLSQAIEDHRFYAFGLRERTTLLVNAIFDLPRGNNLLAPYLGVGAGVALDRHSVGLLSWKEKIHADGIYQIILGFNTNLSKRVALAAECRTLFDFIEIDQTVDLKLSYRF